MWRYTHTDELYHYGVPGMKWGHRKNRSVVSARKAYKQSVKDERKARTKALFDKSTWIAGHDNQQRYKRLQANIKKASANREKAAFKAIDAQAKAAYKDKLTKTGDKAKAEKASIKVHNRAMAKGTYGYGLVGSAADAAAGGTNTRYYNHLKATKGKEYARKVEKRYSKQLVATLAGSVAVMIGSTIYDAYINR